MKIASLICSCSPDPLPPDHFDSGACTEQFPLGMPVAWIRSCLRDIRDDSLHAAGNITTTRLLTCPREILLSDNVPLERYDVRRLNMSHWGNVMHKDMEQHSLPGEYVEIEFPLPGEDPPVVCGVPMRGRIDHVAPGLDGITDYKGHGETSQRWHDKEPYDDTLRAQLSIYGWMLVRGLTLPALPRLFVAHGCPTTKAPPWICTEVPPMTEAEILDVHPKASDRHPSPFTVRDIIEDYKRYEADRAAGMTFDEAIARTRLMGLDMMQGKKCQDWCDVRELCDAVEARKNNTKRRVRL